jgi:electron transport complex protein RnfC
MKVSASRFQFRGGVHPAYHKKATEALLLRTLPTPAQLTISLSQHLGAPATPVVKAGDSVKAGQLLADANGFISAPVHAPVAGRVTGLADAPTPVGRTCQAILLEPDGTDARDTTLAPMNDWAALAPKVLIERVAAAGVVGMGGAGFPTKVKLAPPTGKPVDTLILNGAECEPYLTGDHRLMVEQARSIWEGCRIIRQVLGAKTLRIAIEDNKPDAIRAMEAALANADGDVAVTVLKTSYPQGSEKQQIFSVTGRTVPAGGLPMDVGCVVENVGTTLAVWDAVVNGRPLTHRTITVSGDAVAQPANLLAPIGTSFANLVAACGGTVARVAKIVSGGPMMGFAQATLDVAMTKTSSGLLLFSERCVTPFTSQACIACGRCVDACPMRLVPADLSQAIEADDTDGAEGYNVMDCFECGSCAYVCPARRPLVQHMRRAKAVLLLKRKKATAK